MKERWLLPDGIEEILPDEARQTEALRRRLLDLFATWGYDLVMPPLIEYLEALLTGAGHDLDLQTFKITDQLTGRLMGVRADLTPQVARIDAHYLRRGGPNRLCYVGPVLFARPDSLGGPREPLQVGAEFFGYAGPEADGEIVRLMLESLRVVGLQGVHIDLGHVGVFRTLAREAGLNGEQENEVQQILQRKSQPDLLALLTKYGLDANHRAWFERLLSLHGDQVVLDTARQIFSDCTQAVQEQIANLDAVVRQVAQYVPEVSIHVDLSEIRGYQYHTGVVFSAFLPGQGQAIAQGGRYDDIGKAFGRPRPATGFSTDLRKLTKLIGGEDAVGPPGILAPAADDATLETAITQLRADGERVVRLLPGQSPGQDNSNCDRILERIDGTWSPVKLK